MSDTRSTYLDVAIPVTESDFFECIGSKLVCRLGHEGVGKYCSECGHQLHESRELKPTDALLALCKATNIRVPDCMRELSDSLFRNDVNVRVSDDGCIMCVCVAEGDVDGNFAKELDDEQIAEARLKLTTLRNAIVLDSSRSPRLVFSGKWGGW